MRLTTSRRRPRGQALVEFALAIPVFILILLAIFDFGRGIYLYNGVSEAAREIARATSVHPTDSTATLGQSAETQSVVAVQRALVPSLGTPTFVCNDITGAASSHVPCTSGDYVKVTVSATYRPISPLAFLGQITLSSSSSIEIP